MQTAILGHLRDIRESYAQRWALWRDLATFTTLNDLDELQAALDHCDSTGTDPEAEAIRRFVDRQRALAMYPA